LAQVCLPWPRALQAYEGRAIRQHLTGTRTALPASLPPSNHTLPSIKPAVWKLTPSSLPWKYTDLGIKVLLWMTFWGRTGNMSPFVLCLQPLLIPSHCLQVLLQCKLHLNLYIHTHKYNIITLLKSAGFVFPCTDSLAACLFSLKPPAFDAIPWKDCTPDTAVSRSMQPVRSAQIKCGR